MGKLYDSFILTGLTSLLIFTPLAFGTVQAWSVMVMELLTLFIAAAWLCKMVSQGELTFVKTPLNIPLILFIAYILLQLLLARFRLLSDTCSLSSVFCSLGSVYPYASRAELLKILSYLVVFFVFVNTIRSRKQLHYFLILIVSMGFILSVLGIVQWLSGTDKIFWLKELSPETKGFFGPYVNNNHFAGYMEMAIPLYT